MRPLVTRAVASSNSARLCGTSSLTKCSERPGMGRECELEGKLWDLSRGGLGCTGQVRQVNEFQLPAQLHLPGRRGVHFDRSLLLLAEQLFRPPDQTCKPPDRGLITGTGVGMLAAEELRALAHLDLPPNLGVHFVPLRPGHSLGATRVCSIFSGRREEHTRTIFSPARCSLGAASRPAETARTPNKIGSCGPRNRGSAE